MALTVIGGTLLAEERRIAEVLDHGEIEACIAEHPRVRGCAARDLGAPCGAIVATAGERRQMDHADEPRRLRHGVARGGPEAGQRRRT